jgi:glutamyl/glutaminyl-tRNA synthetase
MTPSLATTLRFAHQANIERYQKLLRNLAGKERAFVESCLAEEQSALQKLAESETRALE